MAIDWELNLFHSDPTLLERSTEDAYEQAGALFAVLADPRRLLLMHALIVGEDTAQRAAVWADIPQSDAERELAAMTLAGLIERRDGARGPAYAPRDGHLVVQVHVALAHGRERYDERHPRLLAKRRAARRVG